MRRKIDRTKEIGASFLLAVQDMFIVDRMYQIIDNRRPIPEQGSAEEFLTYNTGNLFNGFFYSLIFDHLINQSIDWTCDKTKEKLGADNLLTKKLEYLRNSSSSINLISGILGAGSISVLETISFGNTGDVKDIPCAALGALLHTGLRQYSIRKAKETQNLYK